MDTADVVATVLSFASLAIAAFAFLKSAAFNTPSAYLMADRTGDDDWIIRVDNPTRKAVILETIQPVGSEPVEMFMYPANISWSGHEDRMVYESEYQKSGEIFVYCLVEPGMTEDISITPGSIGEQDIEFILKWGRDLSRIDRLLMPRKLRYSVRDLRALQLAATGLTERGL